MAGLPWALAKTSTTEMAEFQEYFGRPKEAQRVPGSGYTRGPVGWAVADSSVQNMPDHRVVSWESKRLTQRTNRFFSRWNLQTPRAVDSSSGVF